MKLVYSKSGSPVSDCLAEEYVLTHYAENKDMVVSTENVITAARVLVNEGKISSVVIDLYFEDTLLEIDRNGRLRRWPIGFCDYNDRWLERLIDWGGVK